MTAGTVILWRHGQTDYNIQLRVQGGVDIPLNATGVQQAAAGAEALARYLGDDARVSIVSSTLSRAAATARALADVLALTVATDARLRERDFGIWEGLTHDQMVERQSLPDPEVTLPKSRVRRHGEGEHVCERPRRRRRPRQRGAHDRHARVVAEVSRERLGPGGRLLDSGRVQRDVHPTLDPQLDVVVCLSVPPEDHGPRGHGTASSAVTSAGSGSTGQSRHRRSSA